MKRLIAATALAVIVTAGCSSSVDNPPDVTPTDPTVGNGNPAGGATSRTPAVTAALYQPAQGIFPFPNDLYFSGTTDGTINIQPANGLIPNQVGLNALDGWSTTAPIRVNFGGPLDPASFSAASVRVYQVAVSNTNKAVSGFTRPLTYGTEFSVNVATDTGVGPTILEIRPLVPLTPSAGPATPTSPVPDGVGYLVLLTNGLRMVGGAAATADVDYATIKTTLGATINPANCATLPNAPMRGACGFTASHLLVAANPALGPLALNPANVVVSFHFTTVATRDTLRALGLTIFNPAAPVPAIAVSPVAIPLNGINAALPTYASARFGTVTVPYYSYVPTPLAPGGLSNDSAVLRTAWRAATAPPAPLTDPANERNLTRFNPIPEVRASKQIPLLVVMPNGPAPGNANAGIRPTAGWPVVIFEHGITRDRSDAFALAQAFAAQGWVIAAVDLPLHGITSTTSPLYQASNEQTFNLDLIVNASGASGPDGVIDPTGTHFINLSYPLASRDNLRQGVVNLLALTRALPTLDLDNDTVGDIDPARIAFIGQSLGSIVGIGFGAALPTPAMIPAPSASPLRVPTMVFSVPGGGVADLLRDSPTFGPRINSGLQAQGLLPGTTLYAQYFRDVQAIVDAGDPLNFVTVAAAQRSIYFQQMVGGGGTTPALPDQVIPNSATQRLITAITNNGLAGGLPFPRAVPGTPVSGDGYVNFIVGDHGSLLSPTASAAATGEMQAESVVYTAGNPTVPIPAGTIVPGALTPAPVQP
jgi:Bacterial virulence factor lipase N-terminal/Platelet-activating factor acetylhydrolase, isoform II